MNEKTGNEITKVKQEMKKIFRDVRDFFESVEKHERKLHGNEKELENLLEKVNRLIELDEAYILLSKNKEHGNELAYFHEKLLLLKSEIESSNLSSAGELVSELNSMKKACHKKYRWKEE